MFYPNLLPAPKTSKHLTVTQNSNPIYSGHPFTKTHHLASLQHPKPKIASLLIANPNLIPDNLNQALIHQSQFKRLPSPLIVCRRSKKRQRLVKSVVYTHEAKLLHTFFKNIFYLNSCSTCHTFTFSYVFLSNQRRGRFIGFCWQRCVII